MKLSSIFDQIIRKMDLFKSIILFAFVLVDSLTVGNRPSAYLPPYQLQQYPFREEYVLRWPLKIGKYQQTNRQCFYNNDCPTQSVCYRQRCVCRVGYVYQNATNQCWQQECFPDQANCGYYFANSECVTPSYAYTGEPGHCVCLYSYRAHSMGLVCNDLYTATPKSVWHRVLGYLTVSLFLPIFCGFIILVTLIVIIWLIIGMFKRRRVQRDNNELDGKMYEDKESNRSIEMLEIEPMVHQINNINPKFESTNSLNRSENRRPSVSKYYSRTKCSIQNVSSSRFI